MLAVSAHALAQGPYKWSPVTIKGNGFINGIVYSPAARGAVFFNTDMGGAYRWDADANQWACMTDWARADDPAAKNLGVETLAVDPTDASRVYMGVGTYMSPTAIMRSTDGGRTFKRTDAPFRSNGNGSARNTGQRMVVDPNAPNVLYYGTRADGLFKSTDAGESWARVTSFPTVGLQQGWGRQTGILFVHVDRASGTPGTPSAVLYAGVFDTTAGVDRIYRSTDAGKTWAGLPGGQPTATNLFPQRMAVSPDGRTAFITYATSKTYPGPHGVTDGRVMRVTDPASASPKWADVTPPANKPAFSAVTLDPADASVVYVSELGNYNPADRIWRSRDGGATWKSMSPNAHRDDSSAPYVKTFRVHWLGDVQIDPFDSNVAMLTTGYGLYRTTNLKADEPTWTFFNDGFEQTAVLELASPSDGPVHLLSAIADRDGYRHTDFSKVPAEGFGTSQGLSRGSCQDVDVAAQDSNLVVRVVNVAPFAQYSGDNGVTWHWFGRPPAGVARAGAIAVSASGRRVAWRPAGQPEVCYAERQGNGWGEWTKAARDAALPDVFNVVADVAQDGVFYGVGDGVAFRSADGGASWTKVSAAAPKATRVRSVHGRAGHLWAAGYDNVGLWRSTDGGRTWTKANPSVAYVVGVGAPKAAGGYPAVFIGGRVNGVTGLFRSDDEGQTWSEISDELHHFGALTTIQGDPRVYGRIYLGTNGRGIVCGDIATSAK